MRQVIMCFMRKWSHCMTYTFQSATQWNEEPRGSLGRGQSRHARSLGHGSHGMGAADAVAKAAAAAAVAAAPMPIS